VAAGYILLTADLVVQLPIFQEGIAAGLNTEAEIRKGFAGFDENGNGLVCFKPKPPPSTARRTPS
jgi:hypothetical protein